MKRNRVILSFTALCALVLIFMFTHLQPPVDTEVKYTKKPQLIEVGISGTNFPKFDENTHQSKDMHCISTIPDEFIETSKESPIIIPEENVLNKQSFNVLRCLYHKYTQTFQRHCTRPSLVGSFRVGGCFVCADPGAIPKQPCLAYSFSVHNDVKDFRHFASMMASNESFSCNVEMYSETAPQADREVRHHIFTKTSNSEIRNIRDILKEATESGKVVNVLAMDLNNTEWEVISELVNAGTLEHVEQLSVRLYSTKDDATSADYIKRLLVLKDLFNAGFRIFWYDRDEMCQHGTNMKAVYGNFTACISVSLIRVMNSPSPIVIPKDPEFNQVKGTQLGELFDSYVTSIQYPCQEIIRIGNMSDGGWDVCHDAKFRPRRNSCLIYSFGISNDFTFDDDIVDTYRCKVNAFDPSMNKGDHQHSKNVMFYATGISDKNDYVQRGNEMWRMRNLHSLFEELGDKDKIVDILKMDVEASEWSSIPEMIESGVLRNVRQFSFELHTDFTEDDNKAYESRLKMLRSIYDIGFRIYYIHRNWHCAFKTKTGKSRTACYEVYTVNTKFAS